MEGEIEHAWQAPVRREILLTTVFYETNPIRFNRCESSVCTHIDIDRLRDANAVPAAPRLQAQKFVQGLIMCALDPGFITREFAEGIGAKDTALESLT